MKPDSTSPYLVRPLRSLEEVLRERTRGATGAAADGSSGGAVVATACRRILVVEDEPILALDIESMLRQSGYLPVGPVLSVEEALRAIEQQTLDAAVLDISLCGQPVFPVARVLRERRVPYMFASGNLRMLELAQDVADAPFVEKPYTPNQIATALTWILRNQLGR